VGGVFANGYLIAGGCAAVGAQAACSAGSLAAARALDLAWVPWQLWVVVSSPLTLLTLNTHPTLTL